MKHRWDRVRQAGGKRSGRRLLQKSKDADQPGLRQWQGDKDSGKKLRKSQEVESAGWGLWRQKVGQRGVRLGNWGHDSVVP